MYLVPKALLGSVTVFDADVARPSRSEMATGLVERLTSSYTRIGTIINNQLEMSLTHTTLKIGVFPLMQHQY